MKNVIYPVLQQLELFYVAGSVALLVVSSNFVVAVARVQIACIGNGNLLLLL